MSVAGVSGCPDQQVNTPTAFRSASAEIERPLRSYLIYGQVNYKPTNCYVVGNTYYSHSASVIQNELFVLYVHCR